MKLTEKGITMNTTDDKTRDEFNSYADVISRTCEACDSTKDYAMCQTCGCCHEHCECVKLAHVETLSELLFNWKVQAAEYRLMHDIAYTYHLITGRYYELRNLHYRWLRFDITVAIDSDKP